MSSLPEPPPGPGRRPSSLLPDAVRRALDRGDPSLREDVSKRILEEAGLSVPRGTTVSGPEDLARSATMQPPLVVKAVGGDLLHKSDVGGVVLGLTDQEAVASALMEVRDRVRAAGHEPEGFLVEEQATGGVEMILGAVRIGSGAWSVLLGLGGVWTEVLGDVGLRIAPLTRDDVRSLVEGLQAWPLLSGARGSAPVGLTALEDQVLAFAGPDGLLSRLPAEVCAVDVNPLLVNDRGCLALDASILLDYAPATPPRLASAHVADVARLLQPRTVAVVGASTRQPNLGNAFLQRLDELDYPGRVHVVHPTADVVGGHPTVRRLRDVQGEIDYAYLTLPAGKVAAALDGVAGRVGFAQVISSGFGETAGGAGLQDELSRVASAEQVRVLGPNCLGTHSPSGRLTFVRDAPVDTGGIAFLSQSGGLSIDVIRQGAARGLGFRGVISLGNCADLRPAELLDWFLDDAETSVVGLYLESVEAGIELLDVVRGRGAGKPVLLLVGGRTSAGTAAAASHTGALAGNERLWPAIARQGGMVLVDTLDELMDCLEVFRFPNAREGTSSSTQVVLFGNGGGTSVLATDALTRAGLEVPTLSADVVRELESLGLPPGNGLTNPIDVPAASMIVDEGRVARTIFSTVLTAVSPAAIVTHVNVGVLPPPVAGYDVVDNIVRAVADADADAGHEVVHLVVLRDDGRPETAERIRRCRDTAHRHELPVFAEISGAIAACRGLVDHRTGGPARTSPPSERGEHA